MDERDHAIESEDPPASQSLDREIASSAAMAGDVRTALLVGAIVAAFWWLARALFRLLGRPI
jgi:hypothetical protein